MTARTVSCSEFLCLKQGRISHPEKQDNNINFLNAEKNYSLNTGNAALAVKEFQNT